MEDDLAALEAHRPAVDRGEEVVEVGGDHVDDMERERRVGGRGGRAPHRLLRPVGVAPMAAGERADEGHGVVLGLPRHDRVGRAAAQVDG
jgi:hypothetical protein